MTTHRTKKASVMRFQRIGGTLQLRIDSAASLAQVLKLDETFWAMTSIDVNSLRFEPHFLKLIDSDGNGKIRSDEVKKAIQYLLDNLSDLSGTVAGSDVLKISAVRTDGSDGAAIIAAAKTILHNLGKKDADEISLDEVLGLKQILGCTDNNGDGVITVVDSMSDEMKETIAAIIASKRVSKDLSGIDGVSIENIDDFKAALQARCDYLDEPKKNSAILPFGADTETIFLLYSELAALIDDYFLNSAAKNFLTSLPERTAKLDLTADLLSSDGVRQVLSTASLAIPTGQDELDLNAGLNPIYANKLKTLANSPLLSSRIQNGKLSLAAWESAKAEIAPYGEWRGRKISGDNLDDIPEEKLRAFLGGTVLDNLHTLAETDAATADALSGRGALAKLLYLQYHIVEFLNNFVSLAELFHPDRPSRLQCGSLVLDGRRFTLICPVQDLAEHKRIVATSNICVFYIEIFQSNDGSAGRQLLAVGVTSGSKRNLFVGKRGVYFDANGEIRDARIIDIVVQPVSVCEALKSPFVRFGEFLGKQTEKIFNTRNADMQKNLSTELNSTIPAKNVPGKAPTPAAQNNNGMAMLLMGGGIGIAAIGSSVAFIVKSLQNISFGRIVAILLGIVVVFGGPMVITSLIKLFNRELSRFLESSGCAINRPMRLSHKMGRFFTYTPRRPYAYICRTDLLDTLPKISERLFSFRRIVLMLIVLIIGFCGGLFAMHAYLKYAECRPSGAAPKKVQENPADTIKNSTSQTHPKTESQK